MDPVTLASLASLFAGGLGSLLGSGQSPQRAAQPYLNEVTGLARDRYNPESHQLLSSQYENLAANPTDFYNELLSSYKPTKGHQFKTEQALKALRNAAANGGYSGTERDFLDQIETSGILEEQGLQNYLANILGLQNTGLSGLQHQSDTGFGDLSNALGQQATLAYKGEAQGQNNQNNFFNALTKAGAAGLGQSQAGQSSQGLSALLEKLFGSQNITPSTAGNFTYHNTPSTPKNFNQLGGNYGLFNQGGR